MASSGRRNSSIFAVPAILFFPFVFAAIFVYYQATVIIQFMRPFVFLVRGDCGNTPDIMGVVGATLGPWGAPLSILVHPTYQTTYYKSIIKIKNGFHRACNILIMVASPLSLPSGGRAALYIYESDAVGPPSGYVAYIDLTSTEMRSFLIEAGETLEIDLLVYLPEGLALPESTSAHMLLAYTPSEFP